MTDEPALAEQLLRLAAAAREQLAGSRDTPTLVPRAAPARATNLPAPTTTFVGREREIAKVKRLSSGSRLVALTGVDGVGKIVVLVERAEPPSTLSRSAYYWKDLRPAARGPSFSWNPGAKSVC